MWSEALDLPPSPGTYVLGLSSNDPVSVTVGALGTWTLPVGVYLYVGSALGPGGLRARLGRHWRGGAARRWHIDYVRARTAPAAAFWATGRRRREHAWARRLAALPGASTPIPRFGASDCRCAAHLFHVDDLPADLAARLGAGVAAWIESVSTHG